MKRKNIYHFSPMPGVRVSSESFGIIYDEAKRERDITGEMPAILTTPKNLLPKIW